MAEEETCATVHEAAVVQLIPVPGECCADVVLLVVRGCRARKQHHSVMKAKQRETEHRCDSQQHARFVVKSKEVFGIESICTFVNTLSRHVTLSRLHHNRRLIRIWHSIGHRTLV